jgi:hypothetical protein
MASSPHSERLSKFVGEVIKFAPFVLAFASVSNALAWRAPFGFRMRWSNGYFLNLI